MTAWLEGTIRGNQKDWRKVETHKGQAWKEMHFFAIDLAHRVGYPDTALREGSRIRFQPGTSPRGPIVKAFEPYVDAQPLPAAMPAIAPTPPMPRATPAGPSSPARPPATDSSTFLNPYHFIPLAPPPDVSLTPAPVGERLSHADSGATHDRYLLATGSNGLPLFLSGRIVCRLVTEGPVVIGSQQTRQKDQPTKITPFELFDSDAAEPQPAIPGSSLRGLISSLAEAASRSAARVLADREYTRRADLASESLSAVGMIVRQGKRVQLRKLTLPVERMRGETDPKECRVYLNGYRKDHQAGAGKAPTVPEQGTFLAQRPLSHSMSVRQFWYARLDRGSFHQRRERIVAWMLDPGEVPIPAAEYERRGRPSGYTRGVLFVLGLEGSKAEDLPGPKKHELFIPYDEEKENRPPIDIPDEVVGEFERLAQDAGEINRGGKAKDYPFLPAGRTRDEPLALEDGDLVYFEEREGRVRRVSFSSVWRRRIPGSLRGAFAKVDPNLVPLHPGRTSLTTAERVFGVVESGSGADSMARALASRVRFSCGLPVEKPTDGWYEKAVTLKILSSPKPPSPALYFGNNGYRSKKDLDLGCHMPQGRKIYLHHQRADIDGRRYVTNQPDKYPDQKLNVTPIRKGVAFLFHVDFFNLTHDDLGLLLYALRPTSKFHHKLGLGKPLGLGEVSIEPLGVCYVDRAACYRPEALFGSKYQVSSPWPGMAVPVWPKRYAAESEGLAQRPTAGTDFPDPERLRDAYASRLRLEAPAVSTAIERLGDPDGVRGLRVSYPTVAQEQPDGTLTEQDGETELYRWFVENEKERHRGLEAVSGRDPLPRLERYRIKPRVPGEGRGGRGRPPRTAR